MSDAPAELQPAQTVPDESSNRADPLAGDWSEGLPGPMRAHGLPPPARLGEARLPPPPPEEPLRPMETPWSEPAAPAADPSWAMAPPANSDSPWAVPPQPAATTEEWPSAPTAPAASDDLWSTAAAPQQVADWSPPPPAPRPKPVLAPSGAVPDEGSWSAPPPRAGEHLTPELGDPKWADGGKPEFAPLPPGESLAAEDDYAPQPVDETEAASFLRPVIEDASALLRPVESAANDATAPPADTARRAADLPGEIVPGEHRVAIHARGGRTRRGSVTDVDLSRAQFALQPQGGGPSEIVAHTELKAIFFMLAAGEAAKVPSGRKVRVTFSDGRSIEGHRDGGDLRQGFFLIPLDAQKTNTKRIYVSRGAVSAVTDVG